MGTRRLVFLATGLVGLLHESGAKSLIVEDYAFSKGGASNPGRTFSIGEWGGVLRYITATHDVRLFTIGIGQWKNILVGRGNYKDKEITSEALQRLYGLTIPQNDEADATAILVVQEALQCSTGAKEVIMRSLRFSGYSEDLLL